MDREEPPTTGTRCQQRANEFRTMCKTKPHELVKSVFEGCTYDSRTQKMTGCKKKRSFAARTAFVIPKGYE